MVELPTGTVPFLFSDIDGSTQRWEQQTQAMPAALALVGRRGGNCGRCGSY